MLISKLSRSPTINHNFVLLEEVVNLETYIVTGAAGFLGYNLTERLMQEEDAHIYAVVRPNSAHNARLAPSERLTIVPADLSEYAHLDEMIDETCDVFFHLAWQGGRYDFAAQYGNIADTLGALEAAGRLGCRRFICTGSQAEYGRQTIAPYCDVAYGAADAEVFSLQPSVEKICHDTGWRPVTDFVDGLRLGYGLLP